MWKQNIPLLIMLGPIILYFLIFKYAPMFGLIVAFKDYNLIEGAIKSPWIGLRNFQLLFNNPMSIDIIRNTLLLSALQIIVGFPFPVLMALLLNEVRLKWFKKSIQTLVYMPHFFSWVIVGGIVLTIFSQETGIVNVLLERWFGYTYPFMYQEASWITVFLGSGIWKEAGFSAIIYLAALASIDPSLYEAASMDGAGKLRKIWHITLPGIRPTMILLFILAMGRVMEVGFDPIYVMQNAAVMDVASVISTYIYTMGIQNGQYSLTTAMGLFESLVGLVLVVTANQIARRFGQELW
ncbi:ABC transporter permease subunit [Paenibacillus sp. PL2-23]|uniref:ABC transporter permease n=1 Tax=Paenibacillus sp. PL2-23 TaxID=2100729 RepID=UPI0030FBED66